MSVSQAAQRRTRFTQCGTSDVVQNFGGFVVRSVQPRGMIFELILTVKIETRHSVEGSFVVNFRPSVIIAELWRFEVARR